MSKKEELLKAIEEDCEHLENCRESFNGFIPCYRQRIKIDGFKKTKCRLFKDWEGCNDVFRGDL